MNTMNTSIPRTQFRATRGPSMAAMHACPKSIEDGCTHDCSQGDECTCRLLVKHDYPQPKSNFWRVPIQMELGKKRRGFFTKLVAGWVALIELAAAGVFVALALGGLGILMGWL